MEQMINEFDDITGYEAIPKDMKDYPNWIVWKREIERDSSGNIKVDGNGETKYTKVPYNPIAGAGAKADTTSPDTWHDFNTIIEYEHRFDGLGFVFTNSPFMGVDLDNIKDDITAFQNGNEDNIVAEFYNQLQTYAEVSPSGNGLHFILRGELPDSGRKRADIEMYDNNRYFTVTGNQFGEYNEINHNGSNLIKPLHEKYIGGNETSKASYKDFEAIPCYGNGLSDDEVLEVLKRSKDNQQYYIDLFQNGDFKKYPQYPSLSEAEQGLVNKLGWYSGYDKNVMDRLFKQSALMNSEWERKASPRKVLTINTTMASKKDDGYKPSTNHFELNINDKAMQGNKPPKFYTYDDTGNAERFIDLFGDNFLFNTASNSWLHYNGKVWEIDETKEAYKKATATANAIAKEPIRVKNPSDDKLVKQAEAARQKHVKYSRSNRGKNSLLNDASSIVAISESKLDKAGNILNLQNGYYNLDDDTFNPHDKDLLLTMISEASYDETANCPLWIQFINETFLGDVELIEYIQRVVGYALSNSTVERQLFILYGETTTGKSVFTNVIQRLLGDYGQNINPEAIMTNKNRTGDSASPAIAKLKNARFVSTSEISDDTQNGKLDGSLVKRLTGNDLVTARFLNQNEFTYMPEFKIFMATNYRPLLNSQDEAMWHRLAIIPFENLVKDIDEELTHKLTQELAGILNWALEGYRRYKEVGLKKKEPQAVKLQRDNYRKELDIVGAFIEQECYLDTQSYVKSSDIYQAYRKWAEATGEYIQTQTKFSTEMNKRFDSIRRSDGKYFIGIQLN